MADLVATLDPYINHYGYWAIFGAILFEDFGVPTPGEATLIVASLLASKNYLHIHWVLLVAWMGAVAGDNIGYAIGRLGGRPLVVRYGRYFLVTPRRLEYSESFFRRHGGIVVLLARFFQILRQLNGIVAGMTEMAWRQFLLYNAAGGAVWVGFWGLLSYFIGERVAHIGNIFRGIGLGLVIIVVLSVGIAIFLKSRRGTKNK
jgi:membrane protein DedA with SNARE-associated domain